MAFLLFVSIIMTSLISFATSHAFFRKETEESVQCKCLTDYENRVTFLRVINATCPHVLITPSCFQYIDQSPLKCIHIDTSKWFYVWRLVLNVEAILNITIATVVWRSPYLPNFLSLFCCCSTIFSSYVDLKWFALIGELIIFVGTYVMLFYGIFIHVKIS